MILNTVFGFNRLPFRHPVKPSHIFQNSQLEYLKNRFSDFLQTKGLFLFSGDSGCGKTTVINYLLSDLNPHLYKITYLNNYPSNSRGFLRLLIKSLDTQPEFYKEDLLEQIIRILDEMNQKLKLVPLLVFDEAQNLSDPVIEEIRLLTSLSPELIPVIVFVAHSGFKARLKLSCYMPLRQRLSLIFQLTPLSKDEIHPYIKFHICLAGVTHPLFSDDAITLIFNHSKGIPRLINKLCLEALYQAAYKNIKFIKDTLIEQVISLDIL